MSVFRGRALATRTRALVVLLAVLVVAGIAVPAVLGARAQGEAPSAASPSATSDVQRRHPDARCAEARVPVSVAEIGEAEVYGELCRPRDGGVASETVQLLVPGSTYNHSYFDLPVRPSRYSYVTDALDAGFSTFNIDRLATGRSTLPDSSRYTLESGRAAIQQVIEKLRAGEIGDHAFARVVWVGHSLGSTMAWGEDYDGVDAFVLTGMTHVVREEEGEGEPSGVGEDVPFMIRAKDDPAFRDTVSDPGYLTTNAGFRQYFYHAPNAEQAVIDADERLKDVSTAADSDGPALPPAQSPSRSITVPTLLVVGDHDQYCTPGTCTAASVLAHERPYYSDEARLEAIVVRDAAHAVQLHKNAPRTNAAILRWVTTVVP